MSSSHDTYELFSGETSGIDGGISTYLSSRRRFYSHDQWQNAIGGLPDSTCVYVGNLKFLTREEQIHQLFSKIGVVKRVIMGLNRLTMTPCGFCFVEYHSHEDAVKASKYLVGAKLDDRIIKVDLDPGFQEGRQYGKSRRTGGQVRDDFRRGFDPERAPMQPPAQSRREEERSEGRSEGRSPEQNKRARFDEPRSENPRFRRERDENED